jgi:hypothetical protein
MERPFLISNLLPLFGTEIFPCVREAITLDELHHDPIRTCPVVESVYAL